MHCFKASRHTPQLLQVSSPGYFHVPGQMMVVADGCSGGSFPPPLQGTCSTLPAPGVLLTPSSSSTGARKPGELLRPWWRGSALPPALLGRTPSLPGRRRAIYHFHPSCKSPSCDCCSPGQRRVVVFALKNVSVPAHMCECPQRIF